MTQNQQMMNGSITTGQMGKLHIMFTLGSAALILPTMVTVIAKQDSWITMIMAVGLNFMFLYAPLELAKRFPGQSLVSYTQQILGRAAGMVYTVLYLFFFLVLTAAVFRNMGDFVGTSVLPETPRWFIHIAFMLIVMYGVALGIEVMGRSSEILFVWVFLVFGAVFALLTNKMQVSNLLPVLADGWIPTIKGLYPITGFPLAEYVYVMMLFSCVRSEDLGKLKRAMWMSSVVIGISGLSIALLLLLVLGADLTLRSPFAVYDMAKEIQIGEVLERVEITVAMIWISTVFTKAMICFYVLCLTTAQLLRFSTYRPLILPLAFIIVPLSLVIYRNTAHTNLFAFAIWPVFGCVLGLLMPMLLLAAAVFRKQGTPSGKGMKDTQQPEQERGGTSSEANSEQRVTAPEQRNGSERKESMSTVQVEKS